MAGLWPVLDKDSRGHTIDIKTQLDNVFVNIMQADPFISSWVQLYIPYTYYQYSLCSNVTSSVLQLTCSFSHVFIIPWKYIVFPWNKGYTLLYVNCGKGFQIVRGNNYFKLYSFCISNKNMNVDFCNNSATFVYCTHS